MLLPPDAPFEAKMERDDCGLQFSDKTSRGDMHIVAVNAPEGLRVLGCFLTGRQNVKER